MSATPDDFMHGIQKDLYGRHPLLTVDYIMSGDVTSYGLLGLVYDRAQEVLPFWISVFVFEPSNDKAFGNATNVIPQRRPLIFLIPDVWSLKRRDFVVFLTLKQLPRTPSM